MRFECVSRTNVGLRRKINEDSLLDESDRGLWVVADGMGGHESGEIASAMVVDTLRQLPHCDGLDDFAAHAIEALKHVNRQLIDLARSTGRTKSIGTTAVCLAIADGSLRCFWAGDSRAYRIRDGQIVRLSRDHSLVQDLVDVGMLRAEEAEAHENSNVITRAVGVAEVLNVDMISDEVRSGDQFLLASDGLTRVVNDEEILAELLQNSADAAADKLIDTVLARGAPDNVTLIITNVF